jgi:MFS family permease
MQGQVREFVWPSFVLFSIVFQVHISFICMTESAWHVPCKTSKEAEIGMGLDGCVARGPSGSQENASPSRPRTNTDNLAHTRGSGGKWSVAAAILPGQLTIAFGMFGVVVALPNIITAFGTDVQTVQWVMTGYLVARVIPMPAMGWLVSQVGQRDLYVLGVLGTTVSTALCGLCTMTIFLIALLLALSQGQQYGWDSGYILGLFGMSSVFLGLFVVTELRVAHPVVHLRLYRNVPFVLASIVVFLYNAGFMGANFLVALMVQLILDFTPIQAGIILAPGALIMGIMGLMAGRLSDRLTLHRLVCVGLALFAIDMYCFSTFSQFVHIGTMTLLVMLQRGAFGMLFSASDTAILRTLPAADRNMGAGLHNMHRGIAMAFGVALCSVLLEKRLASHHLLSKPARLAAYQDCLLAIGVGFLVALVLAWWSRPRTPRTSQPLSMPQSESVQAEKPAEE